MWSHKLWSEVSEVKSPLFCLLISICHLVGDSFVRDSGSASCQRLHDRPTRHQPSLLWAHHRHSALLRRRGLKRPLVCGSKQPSDSPRDASVPQPGGAQQRNRAWGGKSVGGGHSPGPHASHLSGCTTGSGKDTPQWVPKHFKRTHLNPLLCVNGGVWCFRTSFHQHIGVQQSNPGECGKALTLGVSYSSILSDALKQMTNNYIFFCRILEQFTRFLLMRCWDLGNLEWFTEVCFHVNWCYVDWLSLKVLKKEELVFLIFVI